VQGNTKGSQLANLGQYCIEAFGKASGLCIRLIILD
jgi:hypothetical protein